MAKFRSSSKSLRTFKPKPRAIPVGQFAMTIESLAEDGRGVARVKGKTVFVTGALAGEQVEARYQQVHKQFDEAVAVTILQASPDRVEPQCSYYARCGGCNLQHLSDNAQRDYKQSSLQRKFADLASEESFKAPLLGGTLAYRHRVRFSIKADRHSFDMGFRQADSHQIVAIDKCLVLQPAINAILPALQSLLAQLKNRSSLIEVSITESQQNIQGLMLVAKQALCDEDLKLLAQYTADQDCELEVYYLKNKHKQLQLKQGNSELFYTLHQQQLKIPFALSDFTQINPEINQRMVDTAIDWLELSDDDHVADCFCGIGNFTLPLAGHVEKVMGYELVAGMVKKASSNAARNQLANTAFKVSNLMAADVKLPDVFNKVLLDPPRAGAESLCQHLAASSAEKILYISCNPKTLYRDAKILLVGGYSLVRIALADMFPQTSHSEVITLFTRNNNENNT